MVLPTDALSRARRAWPRLRRSCWLIYLAAALPAQAAFLLLVPPMQEPDAWAHLQRAEAVSRLRLFPDSDAAGSRGGAWDTGWLEATRPFEPLPFHQERKVSAPAMAEARAATFTGQTRFTANSLAIYGPLGYAPQALGLALGRVAGLGPLDCYLLARAVTALACLALACLALRLAPQVYVLGVLALPMTVFLFSGVSQDAALIACSALLAALLADPAALENSARRRWGAGGALLVLAQSKPLLFAGPLLCLAVAARLTGRRERIWAVAALAAALGLAWAALVLPGHADRRIPGVDPVGQLLFLLQNLHLIPRLALDTLATHAPGVAEGFIGSLGWSDAHLPLWLYVTAFGVYLLSTLPVLCAPAIEPAPPRLAWAVYLAAGIGLTLLALYLTWTPVGAPVVEGLQGRYFIPFALGLPLAASGLAARRAARLAPLLAAVEVLVVLFPFFCLPFAVAAVLARYH